MCSLYAESHSKLRFAHKERAVGNVRSIQMTTMSILFDNRFCWQIALLPYHYHFVARSVVLCKDDGQIGIKSLCVVIGKHKYCKPWHVAVIDRVGSVRVVSLIRLAEERIGHDRHHQKHGDNYA